jgi:hypothetical protein
VKRANEEVEPAIDPDDLWHASVCPPIGSVSQLREWTKRRRIKKRPIGFTANIDEEYEEE